MEDQTNELIRIQSKITGKRDRQRYSVRIQINTPTTVRKGLL